MVHLKLLQKSCIDYVLTLVVEQESIDLTDDRSRILRNILIPLTIFLDESEVMLCVSNIVVEEFDEDEELPRLLQLFILHQLDVEIISHQPQENKAAIPHHSPKFTPFLQVALYRYEESSQALFVSDADQFTLEASTLSKDVLQHLRLLPWYTLMKFIYLQLLLLLFALRLAQLTFPELHQLQDKELVPGASGLLEIGKSFLEDLCEDGTILPSVGVVGLGVVHDLEKESLDILGLPGKVIVEHFEDDDSEGPNVTLICIVIFGEDLRGEINWDAHELLMAVSTHCYTTLRCTISRLANPKSAILYSPS